MTQEALIAQAKVAAVQHGLLPELVCALIEQESEWNPWLNRYEPDFEASPKYGPVVKTYAHEFAATALTKHGYETTWQTEIKNRCMSWGLMQILGEDAREDGFTGPLPSLCDPAQGLEQGCGKLASCFKQAAGSLEAALLHWNGGASSEYPSQVIARIGRYR